MGLYKLRPEKGLHHLPLWRDREIQHRNGKVRYGEGVHFYTTFLLL